MIRRFRVLFVLAALTLGACGSSGDAPGAGPLAADDATVDDAVDDATDAATGEDATSDGATDAAACAPQPTGAWQPTPHPPTGYQQGLCLDADVDAIVAACFATGATGAACTSAKQAAPACAVCLVSEDGDALWGPIVHLNAGHYYERNVGGCVALLAGATACGEAMNADFLQCGLVACASACASAPGAGAALATCEAAADHDPASCGKLYDVAFGPSGCFTALTKTGEGAIVKPCAWDSAHETIADAMARIGKLFCSGAAVDAGSD